MPNHVTTKINASKESIKSMLNSDGSIDFNEVLQMPKELSMDGCSGIYGDSETAAEAVCKEPCDSGFLGALQSENRLRVDALEMSDKSFEQFVMMVRNKRSHGYYHMMDFAIKVWGTKWNAYDQSVSDSGVQFDTAWSHPKPVIVALSESFPDEIIHVQYADEDTGSNCGCYSIKGGIVIDSNIAPPYSEQSSEEHSKWSEFAIKLKYGEDSKPEDFGMDENWNYIEE